MYGKLPDGAALDAISELLADPPEDIAQRFLDVACGVSGATTTLLVGDGRRGGGTFSSEGLRSDGGATELPPSARAWLEGLVGEGLAEAAPGIFSLGAQSDAAATTLAAYQQRVDGLVAVVAQKDDGPFEEPARRALLSLARFAPAVLRHASGRAASDFSPPAAAAARLQEFGRASPDIFWIFDADTFTAEFVSCAVETVHGRSADDILASSNPAETDVVEEDRAATLASINRAGGGDVGTVEYRIRRVPDGALRWIRSTDFPLLGLGGKIERIGRIARDVTESRVAAEESRRLQIELQHRVRNALSVIRALVRRTAETSETLEDLASHLDGRINAFARVQSALARNPTSGLDLEHLLADEILTSSLQEAGRVTLKGPRVSLTPKAAETLGLVLHELATNALEHGVLGARTGRLRVTWGIRPDRDVPRLVLDWVERGLEAAVAQPTHRGFGTEVLEKTLPYELNGSATVSYESSGLRCALEVPLTPLVLARAA